MCGIVASKDKSTIIKLINANKQRGSDSWSLSVINLNNNTINSLIKEPSEINTKVVQSYLNLINDDNNYYIVHMQAKTTNSVSIHPATVNNNFLWHNGIVKETDIERLQKKYKTNEKWDTKLILLDIYYDNSDCVESSIISSISSINGGIACLLLIDKVLYLFRNTTSIIYTNSKGDVSSINFENSMTEVSENSLNKFNGNNYDFIDSFKSVDNSYYIP